MKNTLCSILTALLIVLIFTPNSFTQDSLQEDIEDLIESVRKELEDAIQESLRDDEKTGKVNKLVYSTDDINFSHDGKRLALAGNYGILIYDIQRSRKNVQVSYKPIKLREHQGRGWRVAFSPDGKLLASANATGLLYIWDAKTEKLLRTIEEEPKYSSFWCMAFSPDGRMIVTGGNRVITTDPWRSEGIVRLWDTQTGEHIRTLTGHKRHVHSVAFSPDGRTIATGGSIAFAKDGSTIDGVVRLWDTRMGEHIRTLTGHRGIINSVAFSPDGTLLASGGIDKPVRLWDVKTGQQIRTLGEGGPGYSAGPRDLEGGGFIGSFGPVDCVAFSSDGRTLASSNSVGVWLWDVKRGRLLRRFRDQNSGGGPTVVAFSPDSRTLAVCRSYELEQIVPKSNGVTIPKEIELWDAETGKHLHRIKLERYRLETYP